MSGDGTARRASPRVAWWKRVAGFVLPVLLAFMVMVVVWLEPLERWIAHAAAWSRSVLPSGDSWSMSGGASANVFALLHNGGGWSAFLHWFDATPWPALVILMIATTRWIAWTATRSMSSPRDGFDGAFAHPRFGGLSESTMLVVWCAIGAVTWRFWWGLSWDHLGNTWFPTSDGPVVIGLLWLGAAIGYAWTIAMCRRRLARRDGGQHCASCNYLRRGLETGQSCPECGHDPRRPLDARRRIAAVSRRWGPLAAAIVLLAAPYLSTLLAAFVNVLRGL